MQRYFIDVSGITEIITLQRYEDTNNKGVKINNEEYEIEAWSDRDLTKLIKYDNINELSLLKRQIPLLPESTDSNTTITSNGLVAVLVGNKVTIVDLFETGDFDLNKIIPNEAEVIKSYSETTNPEYKRIFIVNKDGDYLTINNTKMYEKGEFTYFFSNMDYPLLKTDDYGFYEIKTDNWTDYEKVDTFQFYTKTQFSLSGIDIKEVELLKNDDSTETITGVDGVYFIPPAYTTGSIIRFKIKPRSSEYGTLIVR